MKIYDWQKENDFENSESFGAAIAALTFMLIAIVSWSMFLLMLGQR